VAGGVEFVPCSLPEARSLIDAGKVRSLAVMATSRAALYPNVPTLKQATGSELGHWRLARHRGTQGAAQGRWQEKLTAAVKRVYDSKDYKDFMVQRGFGMIWGNSEEFGRFMAKGDADMAAVMKTVGLAK
jgi:tripartite-type tricarboxylate transporter receptor subunit TctC